MMSHALRLLGMLATARSAAGLSATGSINLPGAEIVAYHESTKLVYVIGGGTDMYVVDASTPSKPSLLHTVPLAGASQSVSVNSDGLVAVAVGITGSTTNYTSVKYHANRQVQLFERVSGAMMSRANLTVGSLPDSLAFSPAGTQIVTANEGEPGKYYTQTTPAKVVSSDPPGTISIIDVDKSNYPNSQVTTLGFASYNSQLAALKSKGIRISGPDSADDIVGNLVEQDMEPEYVTIEGTTAYVSAQENNAIVEVDLVKKQITSITSAGEKDWDASSSSLVVDTSDKDGAIKPGNRPFVGIRMPDGIDTYVVSGQTYIVMANEGDGRVRPDDVNLVVDKATHLGGSSEAWLAIETTPTAASLVNMTDPFSGSTISIVSATNATYPAGHEHYKKCEDEDEFFITAQYGFKADDDFYSDEKRLYKYSNLTKLPTWVQANGASKSSLIGRLKTVSTETDTNSDGFPDKVVGFGGRSFSIMKPDGTIVYDSGDATEQSAIKAGIYDDGRSDDKGTEPEGVTLAVSGSKSYAFVALERVNAVQVFDVTDPTSVSELRLINTNAPAGGKGPECVVTNTADDLVIVANEAGTTGLVFYSLKDATATDSAKQTATKATSGATQAPVLAAAVYAIVASLV